MDFPILGIGVSTWLNLFKRVINGEFSPLTKFLPLDTPRKVTRKRRTKKVVSPGEIIVKRKRGRPKKSYNHDIPPPNLRIA
jgi:hypothetical protein